MIKCCTVNIATSLTASVLNNFDIIYRNSITRCETLFSCGNLSIIAILPILRNNSKQMNNVDILQSAPIVFIKSNFEYLRGNYRKSMKVLHSVPTDKATAETGESLGTMFNNNLGVIHFHMKKHHLASFYFRNAMQENDKICAELHRVEHSELDVHFKYLAAM